MIRIERNGIIHCIRNSIARRANHSSAIKCILHPRHGYVYRQQQNDLRINNLGVSPLLNFKLKKMLSVNYFNK